MKTLLTLILLFQSLYAFKTEEKLHIGTETFTVIHESYDEYGDKGITMKLYTSDSNTSGKPLLSLVLENQTGSCSQKSVEEGTYYVDGDTLRFYSHWSRYGKAYDSPIGDRVQVYKIDNNKMIHRVAGRVYIEKTKRYKDAPEGMKYLYKVPQTEKEREALYKYIRSIERIYGATFVQGEDAKKLADEVHTALVMKQKQRWK